MHEPLSRILSVIMVLELNVTVTMDKGNSFQTREVAIAGARLTTTTGYTNIYTDLRKGTRDSVVQRPSKV